MQKIDIANWGEFVIGDLFITEKEKNKLQVPTGGYISKKDLIDGNIPRITVSGINNGIIGYYDTIIGNNNYREYENFISVSFLGTVFYQPNKSSLDMKVHCLKPKKYVLNEYSGAFLVSIIRKMITYFDYKDQLSSTLLPTLKIVLPIDKNGQPDWVYMETYMKRIMAESKQSLENLKRADDTKQQIGVSGWKRFHLYDDNLFDIDMGTKLDKAKMSERNPTVNFVGRANANNGITTCVDEIEGLKPYDAGSMTLSLGGEYLGSCFIQPKPFYTSQNVVVLIPKHNMSDNIKRFIATLVFRESRSKYKAFVDELNRHIKTDFAILLPITQTGEPDWQYMENYMKNIISTMQNNLTLFQAA